MLTLGIESSCDDTSFSVLKDKDEVLSCVVSSQDDIHSLYGGIVPELASRRHIEMVVPVVEEALKRAGVGITDIGAIAATRGPGLVGSILIGLNFAKAVAYAHKLPLIGVNHLEAHAQAAFLKDKDGAGATTPEFPFIALIVSGGHTSLLYVTDHTSYELLGQSRDDAAGEAFDKVAKLLGLGYPGGVAIDRLSKGVDPGLVEFKRPIISKGNLEFSFSGIKTAVLTYLKKNNIEKEDLSEDVIAPIASGFQEAAVDVLVKKCVWAMEAKYTDNLVISGGVACNSRLREKLSLLSEKEGFKFFAPPPRYCSDNAAMIAFLGGQMLSAGDESGLDLNATPDFLS